MKKGKGGKPEYPVDTPGRAKAALGLVGMHGSPEEKAKVRAKVHREFPNIKQKAGKNKGMKHEPHHAIGSHHGYHHL